MAGEDVHRTPVTIINGKDFMFMICSEACAVEMKSVMDVEAALGNALFGNLEELRN